MGWKDNARRLVIGERKELNTFEGYWIRPKKYSIQAKDEINAAQLAVQKGIDKKAFASMLKKAQGKAEAEVSELLELMTPDEMNVMIDMQNAASKDLVRLKILHGVGEHNFEGSTVQSLAEDILEYEDIAVEMVGIIEDFNRPLAPKKSNS